MNITSLLCLFSLSKGASVGNTQLGISEPMAWPSCLLLRLMPECHARRMVGGNAREQAVLCHAGLGSAQVLDLTVGVRGLVCQTTPDIHNIRDPSLFPLLK